MGGLISYLILIYFLAFLPLVLASPAASDGPMGMIFGVWVCLGSRMLIFDKSGSKVKGHGQKSKKNCLFGPIFGTEVKYGYEQDQGGSGGVPLASCQLLLATCQKFKSDGSPPLDGFPSIGKLPV